MKDYHVFISYSRDDDPNYQVDPEAYSPIGQIVESLTKAGIKPWIDREGKYVGENYLKEIVKGINNSEMMLFVSSKNSNASYFAPLEVCKAADKKMKIFLLLLDDTPFHEDIDLLFSAKDKRWFYPNPDKSMDDLIYSINKEISKRKKKEAEEAERARLAAEKAAAEKAAAEEAEREKERIAKLEQEVASINNLIIEYVERLQACMKDLLSKKKELNNTAEGGIHCPVCNNTILDMETDFCDICGWHFSIPKELGSAELQELYEKRLIASQAIWTEKQQRKKYVEELKKEKNSLVKEKETVRNELLSLQDTFLACKEEHERQTKAKQDEIASLKKELGETKQQQAKLQKKADELDKTKKEYSEFRNKQNEARDEGKKQLKAKDNEIQKLTKELQDVRQQLAEAQQRANKVGPTIVNASAPMAYLLVEEDGEANVYMLHEGVNVFGSMHAKIANAEGYQMIVSFEPELKAKHFSLTSTNKGDFALHVLENATVGINSPSNTVQDGVVSCGDILYIGKQAGDGQFSGLKIYIKDNFNK